MNTIQNGKGDSPRNLSALFRTNYDQINWHTKPQESKTVSKKKCQTVPLPKHKSSDDTRY